ncbi:hypothetical protein BKA56DRAFT_166008 [Ilyonectria sp. MPI-CAGE-AT-0026]|nr:hypothetical protein BKA56DRAFT_199679 [Ilyonectria sp. MPI-CAGE-AT-0026]KAH6970436.1 hypothetical protein BKA56DRAFT_166008 [Ilyonectria sp. MPI-CAGE-AT-0026]
MRAASGSLRQPPGPRSGGLRPEDPPAGGLRPGPDRIPSSRSGSCSRHHTMIPKCDIPPQLEGIQADNLEIADSSKRSLLEG